MKTVIEMAREAGLHIATDVNWMPIIGLKCAEKFAELVRADEREAIAQSLDKQADLAPDEIDRQWAQEMAAAVRAIRARSNT
jgi:hypothetical protein